MAPAQIRINFDNPTACYSPGERISGKVILHLEREKEIIGIDLNRVGKAKVTQTSRGTPGQTAYRRRSKKRQANSNWIDSISLLKDTIQLRRENKENNKVPAGTYEYPFSWLLPDNLPASFEGPFGWTTYRMEVVVRYSFWDYRCEAEADFFVTGKFDLNNLDRCFRQVTVENKWIYVFTQHGRDYLELTFELERKAYVPGEAIRFAATPDYRSDGGHLPIPGVQVSLVQEQTYRITDNLKKNAVKVHKMFGPMVFANAIEVWNGEMVIPPVPPTALGGGCWFIDVQYYVKVRLELTENDKIEFYIKILIGTIPLRRRRSRPPSLALDGHPRELSLELPPLTPIRGSPVRQISTTNGYRGEFPSLPAADYLSVTPGPSRRASAPPVWLEEAVRYDSSPPGASPGASPGSSQNQSQTPSAAPGPLELETPPPSYSDAVFFSSVGFLETSLPGPSHQSSSGGFSDDPPEYQRPPPFFLRKGASHLFDSYNERRLSLSDLNMNELGNRTKGSNWILRHHYLNLSRDSSSSSSSTSSDSGPSSPSYESSDDTGEQLSDSINAVGASVLALADSSGMLPVPAESPTCSNVDSNLSLKFSRSLTTSSEEGNSQERPKELFLSSVLGDKSPSSSTGHTSDTDEGSSCGSSSVSSDSNYENDKEVRARQFRGSPNPACLRKDSSSSSTSSSSFSDSSSSISDASSSESASSATDTLIV